MFKVSGVVFGVLLAFSLVLTGCEGTKCEPCEDGCPSFLGEYYGTIESLNETCADVALLTGDKYIKVIAQTPLELESRDNLGRWSVLTGTLCDTTDKNDPKNYSFSAYYSPDTTDSDYTLNYTLAGFFTGEHQAEKTDYPATVTATLDLHFVFDDGETCTLAGDVQLSRALPP
jgi:hypothetical protein